MTSTLDPLTAGEVYVHAIEPRRRGPLRRFVLGALDLWCANFGGTFELTRAADVVVRRRFDGVEELRVEVHSGDDAAQTLSWTVARPTPRPPRSSTWTRIDAQLEELDPEEFRASWSMD